MRIIATVILALFVCISCEEGSGNKKYLQKSVGNLNVLQVVMDNELWNGPVGEEIRHQFAAPVDGLPQDEPLFSMRQMPPEAFTGFATSNRLFLQVAVAPKEAVKIADNEYAKPQRGAIITAADEEALIALLKGKSGAIIKKFKQTEIKERQRRSNIQLMKLDSLPADMKIKMKLPSAYRIAKASPDFYWLRKDLKSGSTNIIIYEVPMHTIGKDSTLTKIINMRNTIGASLMPVEEDGIYRTEEAYPPYLFNIELDGHFTYETKGIWDVKDQYMSGPFINYAIQDIPNNRWLIVEGFVYAPSVPKRDLQFELEAIIKTTKILE